MTKAYIEKVDTGCHVMLIDHADGSPEVCAAISCLAYTLAGWLANNQVKVYEKQLEPGFVSIRFAKTHDSEVAFDVFCIGLLQLENSFPDYLKVKSYGDLWGETE